MFKSAWKPLLLTVPAVLVFAVSVMPVLCQVEEIL